MTDTQKTDLELLIDYAKLRIKVDGQPDGYGKAISEHDVKRLNDNILMSVGRLQLLLDDV